MTISESKVDEEIKKNLHIRELDGVRGLAVTLVVSGHFFYQLNIFKSGWTGLNLFFLLSGYLITSRLFSHISSSPGQYFKNFYIRRILRIFPLYYGSLIFFLWILPIFYTTYEIYFENLQQIQLWYWLYISNWRIILHGLPPPLFFHFWSLAVEEQFYIFWPVIFLLVRRFNARIGWIGAFIALSVFLRIVYHDSHNAYFNTFVAAEPFLLGSLICLFEKKKALSAIYRRYLKGIVIVPVAIFVVMRVMEPASAILSPQMLLLGYSSIDLVWLLLIWFLLANVNSQKPLNNIFRSLPLVWLGKYSYGIYVFHWFVLQLFVNRAESRFPSSGIPASWSYWIIRAMAILITLILSYLSYHLYEKKFLLLKKRFVSAI